VGATYTDPDVTYLFFVLFYSSTELHPIILPVNQFSRTVAQKTRSGVMKTFGRMRNV